jgi:glycosyltransferase involved in cell wall biosynthesis
MSADDPKPGRGMRVIAWPARAPDNPYTRLLYDAVSALGVGVVNFTPRRLLRGRYDIWHLHWPERFLNDPRPLRAWPRAAMLLALVRLARRRGTRIVWTVHNLGAHEARYPAVERRFWRAFTRMLDGWVALTAGGAEAARRRFPALASVPGFVTPLGHLREAYPDGMSRTEARAELGIPAEATVLASIGYIRPYKNIPELVRAFRALPRPGAQLLIAGEVASPGAGDAVAVAAGNDPRILFRPGFAAPAEVQRYLRAADLVVLAFREILNSASAMLALSFDRPVLAPRLGAITELAEVVGDEWLRTYDPPLTVETLEAAIEWAAARPRTRCARLDRFDWSEIARQTVAAYAAVIGRRPAPAPSPVISGSAG